MCIRAQFLFSFLEVTKTADSWWKMATSAKLNWCVNYWDFVSQDMYSRYKECVKRIFCCGGGVVPCICEEPQKCPSRIVFKHLFRSYLEPTLNNMCTGDSLWRSNFLINLKKKNAAFVCTFYLLTSANNTYMTWNFQRS